MSIATPLPANHKRFFPHAVAQAVCVFRDREVSVCAARVLNTWRDQRSTMELGQYVTGYAEGFYRDELIKEKTGLLTRRGKVEALVDEAFAADATAFAGGMPPQTAIPCPERFAADLTAAATAHLACTAYSVNAAAGRQAEDESGTLSTGEMAAAVGVAATVLGVVALGATAYGAARGIAAATGGKSGKATSPARTIDGLASDPVAGRQLKGPRSVRRPRGVNDVEAEELCAEWMRVLGDRAAMATPPTRDGGVDVESGAFAAQVKNIVGTVETAHIHAIHGVAQARGKQAVFFTSGTYSAGGREFADGVGIPLFRYDAVAGVLEAANVAADGVLRRGVF